MNHKKGEDGQAFLFFAAGLSAFSAQAVPIQNVFLPMLQQSLTVLESWTILDFLNYLRPFGTISDHFLTILDRFMTFLLILWHFLNISWPSWTFFNITWYFLIILDHFLNILNHFLIFSWYFLTIFWHFLAILDHFWEGISRNDLQFYRHCSINNGNHYSLLDFETVDSNFHHQMALYMENTVHWFIFSLNINPFQQL